MKPLQQCYEKLTCMMRVLPYCPVKSSRRRSSSLDASLLSPSRILIGKYLEKL